MQADVARCFQSPPQHAPASMLQLWTALQDLSPRLRSGCVVHNEAAAKELYLLWKWNSLFTRSSFCFLTGPDKRTRPSKMLHFVPQLCPLGRFRIAFRERELISGPWWKSSRVLTAAHLYWIYTSAIQSDAWPFCF